jgi:hypothetical protein
MSEGANKAFLADPLGFLNSNIVVPHNTLQGVAQGQAKVIKVNLEPDVTGNTCVNAAGQNVPMFRATGVQGFRSPASNAFDAYYLPYMNNTTKQMNLGTAADYFFTDKIDGCTFAAGTGQGQTPLVAHLNQQRPDGTIDQPALDNTVAHLFVGAPGYRQLSLPDYISPEEQLMKTDPTAAAAKTHVTVIGIRGSTGWSFYFQRRNWVGGLQYRLIDTTLGYTAL